jgi:HEAT repeat protein
MIQEILKLAEDERPYARQAAIQVLGQIGDDSVVEDLLMQLNDVNRDVRKAAVQALSQIQVAPGLIVGDLVPRLGDEYKDVRVATAEALGKMGDARAVEGLLDRLGDSHPDVRRAAARALGEIGGERAINGLRQQLGDFNADVRRETIEALEESDAIIPNWILPMLKDPDRAVRTTAIRTLVSEFGDRKMLQLISLGLDASAPWIDPKNPITWEDLMTVESELGIPVKEAQDAYERLNERLKGNLDLVWQDKPRNSDTD